MTSGFIDRIITAIHAELEAEYLSGLPKKAPHRAPSLHAALEAGPGKPPPLMVEFKRRSPGHAEPGATSMDVSTFAKLVRASSVAGVSALACRPEFDGSPQTVAEVAASTERPVLFKDFVIDPLQVEAASRAGASAVLLIARLETESRIPGGLERLAWDAHRRGLEVFLEVHQASELKLASRLPWDVLGVNVRDLDTLRLDPATAIKTLRAARGRSPLVAMSGIGSAADARPLLAAGAGSLLVGTAFVRSGNPGKFLRELGTLRSGKAS